MIRKIQFKKNRLMIRRDIQTADGIMQSVSYFYYNPMHYIRSYVLSIVQDEIYRLMESGIIENKKHEIHRD